MVKNLFPLALLGLMLPAPYLVAAEGERCTYHDACPGNMCCSREGWCGNTEVHCGWGCQSGACFREPMQSNSFPPRPTSTQWPNDCRDGRDGRDGRDCRDDRYAHDHHNGASAITPALVLPAVLYAAYQQL